MDTSPFRDPLRSPSGLIQQVFSLFRCSSIWPSLGRSKKVCGIGRASRILYPFSTYTNQFWLLVQHVALALLYPSSTRPYASKPQRVLSVEKAHLCVAFQECWNRTIFDMQCSWTLVLVPTTPLRIRPNAGGPGPRRKGCLWLSRLLVLRSCSRSHGEYNGE